MHINNEIMGIIEEALNKARDTKALIIGEGSIERTGFEYHQALDYQKQVPLLVPLWNGDLGQHENGFGSTQRMTFKIISKRNHGRLTKFFKVRIILSWIWSV